MKIIKNKPMPLGFTGKYEGDNFYIYYKEGLLHRNGGPAYEQHSGYQEWHIEGLLHRINGPAVIFSNGDLHYYKEGKLHREDGPAIILNSGYEEYWLNDKLMSKEEFYKIMNSTTEENPVKETSSLVGYAVTYKNRGKYTILGNRFYENKPEDVKVSTLSKKLKKKLYIKELHLV